MRSTTQRGFEDFHAGEAERRGVPPGKVYCIPPSHTSSPACMHQWYLDATEVCLQVGKPDNFTTLTCNPDWKEIRENLEPGESFQDRPDLVVRVFKERLDIHVRKIEEGVVFGGVLGLIYTIEFQKRGLPHAHIVIWHDEANKIRNASDLQKMVRKSSK